MSRRLMLRNASGGGILPPEYQQVEWIKPTNAIGNYIQLPNFYFNGADVFRAKIKIDSAVTSEKALLMGRTSQDITIIEVGSLSNNRIFSYSSGGTSSIINGQFIYGQWMDLIATYSLSQPTKKLEAIISGVHYYGTDGSGTNLVATSARLFLFNNPSHHNFTLPCELAFAQLDGKFTVYPCYRKSDSVIGVYDVLSETFFAGTGSFTKGADVN